MRNADIKIRAAYQNKKDPDLPRMDDRGHPTEMTDEEFYLFASVIAAETGDKAEYDDMLAIANVIINRLETGKWGHTLSEVVHAEGQFKGMDEVFMNRVKTSELLENNPLYYRAARDACNGINNIGNYLYYDIEVNALKTSEKNGEVTCDLLDFDSFFVQGAYIFFRRSAQSR